MSTLSQFLGSAGGGSYANKRVISYSGDFIIPAGVVKLRAHAWGGGGGGAMVANSSGYAGGGAGGGYSAYDFTVTPGTTITIVIGAGGAAIRQLLRGSGRGRDGGNTSVTYGSKTITAYGGEGGANTLNGVTNNIGVGSAGGAAVGGTVNIPGGNCHFIIFSGFSGVTHYLLASGGGAAGTPMYGTPPNASISFANTRIDAAFNGNSAFAFGGIGLGGYHVFANNSPAASPGLPGSNQLATGGGGTYPLFYNTYTAAIGAAGLPAYGTGLFYGGAGGYTDYSNFIGSSIFLNVFGGGGNSGGAGGPGGGGGSRSSFNVDIGLEAHAGGVFAGGSSSCQGQGALASSYAQAGSGGLGGGGGGGVAFSSSNTLSCISGAGGNGLVILEW